MNAQPAQPKGLAALPFRISTQLYAGIGGAVALTIAASLVGWFSFNRVAEVQRQVNQGSVPEMAAAFGVARYSSTLVAAAPRLTAAATAAELALVAADVEAAHRAFAEQVAALEQRVADDQRVMRMRGHADTLLGNTAAIQTSMTELFALSERRAAVRAELTGLNSTLEDLVIPAVDDQFFYLITGYRTLDEPAVGYAQHFSVRELSLYRHLAELQADAHTATQLLASAFSLADAPQIEPLRERFEAAAGRIERSLAQIPDSPLRAALTPLVPRLFALGVGPQSGFDLLAQELRLRQRQEELLALNREIAVALVEEVDGLVSGADARVQAAKHASTQALLTGRSLLLAISAISIGGAVLIAWLYVGRILLRRLQRLSNWMRRMAGGDLEAKVEIGGRDEVADMAAALEVFRRHALEVQRLNLVERLAEELQGKNDELERVLADLRRAQDQIVMREKLAALGELTAGVAHEIRNPLNFVTNFSEVSAELLTELTEILVESGGALSAEQRQLIQEISQDLSGNLERIRSHGARANRIVRDMLMMGRGSAEVQPTEINTLVDEYAGLAYHSARAADPEFQLDIRRDFAPDAGSLEVNAQDLGRVFLNMVSNACHATDAKRQASAAPGREGESYTPTLWLVTRRGEHYVEVRIRDNGIGIAPEVIADIFNPFFTTKPPDQGTGLGLAISSDIVRQHGGSIRVDTEAGQFTEMIVQLPLEPPATDAGHGSSAPSSRVARPAGGDA